MSFGSGVETDGEERYPLGRKMFEAHCSVIWGHLSPAKLAERVDAEWRDWEEGILPKASWEAMAVALLGKLGIDSATVLGGAR